MNGCGGICKKKILKKKEPNQSSVEHSVEMETVDADHNRNEIDFFFGKFLFLSFIFKQETIAPKRATGVKWFSFFFALVSSTREWQKEESIVVDS